MAFSLGEENDQGMTEMNLIPLIDIMLVLMIIFLVTATVANPSIPLTLPNTNAKVQEAPQDPITVQITANNEFFIDKQVFTLEQLAQRLKTEGQATKRPAINLEADKDAKYDSVAQVMSYASDAGLTDISFVSEN